MFVELIFFFLLSESGGLRALWKQRLLLPEEEAEAQDKPGKERGRKRVGKKKKKKKAPLAPSMCAVPHATARIFTVASAATILGVGCGA